MTRRHGNRPSLLFVLLLSPIVQDVKVPITVDVLRPVEVRASEQLPDGSSRQLRGVLYADTSFVIDKGERLVMVRVLDEGGCLVRIRRRVLELRSCPWLPGFTDPQRDFYRMRQTRTR
jgi:hypothetical protein